MCIIRVFCDVSSENAERMSVHEDGRGEKVMRAFEAMRGQQEAMRGQRAADVRAEEDAKERVRATAAAYEMAFGEQKEVERKANEDLAVLPPGFPEHREEQRPAELDPPYLRTLNEDSVEEDPPIEYLAPDEGNAFLNRELVSIHEKALSFAKNQIRDPSTVVGRRMRLGSYLMVFYGAVVLRLAPHWRRKNKIHKRYWEDLWFNPDDPTSPDSPEDPDHMHNNAHLFDVLRALRLYQRAAMSQGSVFGGGYLRKTSEQGAGRQYSESYQKDLLTRGRPGNMWLIKRADNVVENDDTIGKALWMVNRPVYLGLTDTGAIMKRSEKSGHWFYCSEGQGTRRVGEGKEGRAGGCLNRLRDTVDDEGQIVLDQMVKAGIRKRPEEVKERRGYCKTDTMTLLPIPDDLEEEDKASRRKLNTAKIAKKLLRCKKKRVKMQRAEDIGDPRYPEASSEEEEEEEGEEEEERGGEGDPEEPVDAEE